MTSQIHNTPIDTHIVDYTNTTESKDVTEILFFQYILSEGDHSHHPVPVIVSNQLQIILQA